MKRFTPMHPTAAWRAPLGAMCLIALPLAWGLGTSVLAQEAGPPAPPASQSPRQEPVEKGPDPQDWQEVDTVEGQPVTTQRSYFPSGKLRRILTQRPGVIGPQGHHGRDVHLYENGVIRQEAQWRMGQLDGPYREWFEGGQLKIQTQYQANQRQGVFEEYGEAGVLRIRGHYQQGVLHGALQLWFAGGDNQELSHWDQGVQVGLHRVWLKNNTPVRAVHYQAGQLHGSAIEYHPIPDEERVRQQGTYAQGDKQGEWKEFDAEGQLLLLSTYQAGVLSGPYRQWKGGVAVLETQYEQGLEQGQRKEFYLSGKPFADGLMKDGLREGPWKYWNEDGTLQDKWSGVYRSGKKVSDLEDSSAQGGRDER